MPRLDQFTCRADSGECDPLRDGLPLRSDVRFWHKADIGDPIFL